MQQPLRFPGRERGAALIVGLILMLVMTILAVATMGTANVEVVMASNTQYSENAFQLAETGIDVNIATVDDDRRLLVAVPGAAPVCAGPTEVPEVGSFTACTTFADEITPLPGSSVGIGAGFAAYHFNVTSRGESFRGARAIHDQSFYIAGPTGQ